MDCRKWLDKYSTDCRLKYPSLATQKNYISQQESAKLNHLYHPCVHEFRKKKGECL